MPRGPGLRCDGPVNGWGVALGLAGLLHGVQLDLDCTRPAAARELIGRARLSEIEWAEDVNRSAIAGRIHPCDTIP